MSTVPEPPTEEPIRLGGEDKLRAASARLIS